MKRMNFPRRKEFRQDKAGLRQEKYDQLTAEEKLARLDNILGEGVGAAKQRARLRSEIENKNKKSKSGKNKG